MLSPPRERPKASRSLSVARSLSFDGAPCGRLGVADDLQSRIGDQMRRRGAPGIRGMLVGPHHRRVDFLPPSAGWFRPEHSGRSRGRNSSTSWSTFPRPTNGDAGYRMLVIDGLPVPVTTGQIPLRATGPSPSQHPVDHHTMIDLPPTPTQRAIR